MNQKIIFKRTLIIFTILIIILLGWYLWYFQKFYFSKGFPSPLTPIWVGVLVERTPQCDSICHFSRGEIVVSFKNGIDKERAENIITKLGYRVASDLWYIRYFTVRVPFFKERQAIEKFRLELDINLADYNYVQMLVTDK